MLSVTLFKDPTVAIWTWNYIQEAACDLLESYRKPPVTSKVGTVAANEGSTLRNIVPSSRKEEYSEKDFSRDFQY
jgi:hypothetical protein